MDQHFSSAQRFALHLYKNNHLENFSIEKEVARLIFYQEFKKEYDVRRNFGCVFSEGLHLLKAQKNHAIICYKQNNLIKLLQKERKIMEEAPRAAKRSTMICQSLSFNINKKNEEEALSRDECKLCGVKFENDEDFEEHVTTDGHSFFENFNKALKLPSKTWELKFTIDNSPVFNNIILRKNVPKTLHFGVKNVSNEIVQVLTVQIQQSTPDVQFNPVVPYNLPPSILMQHDLKVCCKTEGILYFPILIFAQIGDRSRQFAVELVFHTHDESLDDLHPVAPFKRTTRAVLKERIETVDRGQRANLYRGPPPAVALKQYKLPAKISVVLNTGLRQFSGMPDAHRHQLESMKKLLDVEDKKHCLSCANYTKMLDLLLFIEEHQMCKDIRDYDREDMVLKRTPGGRLLELEVPDLAEHRPSVMVNDSVFVRESKQSGTLFEGYVHEVREASVLLKFSNRFFKAVFSPGKKFYVNFSFNRYPLKVEHQAVEFTRVDNIGHLLFPKSVGRNPIAEVALEWFNRDIVNNPEQQQAVRAILQKTAMPAPYLVFGPPGTGKTMTIVEAVKQIHKNTKRNVLVCTPTNSAANEVTRRLVDTISEADLLRFAASSVPRTAGFVSIEKYTNYKEGQYSPWEATNFDKYRVVVSTLVSAARLVNGGCPRDLFSYVFIDESGQATETQSLIPIARILSKSGCINGQIVLAGDPRQLGPVIHSPLAKEYGFEISMLERLMDSCEAYKKDSNNKYNPRALTKLLKNYRSHPVIMHQPNVMFYDGELLPAGDSDIHEAVNWEALPNPKFPMVFHGVVGIEQREKTSPSFFNIQEIQVVSQYLDKLIGHKMQNVVVKEEHVGIVTPYKKQADKIRRLCTKKRYSEDLLVGSVEQFQGQERLVIIISTVRSKYDFLNFDHKFHLGFLDNPKRFNVAVTRAKALLIIVGNPNILQYDKYWKELIRYCKENNATTGVKVEFKDDVDESLSDAQNMSLLTNNDPEEGCSFTHS